MNACRRRRGSDARKPGLKPREATTGGGTDSASNGSLPWQCFDGAARRGAVPTSGPAKRQRSIKNQRGQCGARARRYGSDVVRHGWQPESPLQALERQRNQATVFTDKPHLAQDYHRLDSAGNDLARLLSCPSTQSLFAFSTSARVFVVGLLCRRRCVAVRRDCCRKARLRATSVGFSSVVQPRERRCDRLHRIFRALRCQRCLPSWVGPSRSAAFAAAGLMAWRLSPTAS